MVPLNNFLDEAILLRASSVTSNDIYLSTQSNLHVVTSVRGATCFPSSLIDRGGTI